MKEAAGYSRSGGPIILAGTVTAVSTGGAQLGGEWQEVVGEEREFRLLREISQHRQQPALSEAVVVPTTTPITRPTTPNNTGDNQLCLKP